MTLPTESQASPHHARPVPVQVIGYASGDTVAGASTGTRILLGFIAGLHLLVGVPLVVWAVAGSIANVTSASDPAAMIWLAAGLLVGAVDVACGVWVIVRRPWTWRAAHVGLAALCALELTVCGFGAGLIVAYKHATGWDGIALGVGIVLFAVASGLFWLHALSKLALLRRNVRQAFLMGDAEPVRLHRVGTIVMTALYGAVVLIGGIAYLVR